MVAVYVVVFIFTWIVNHNFVNKGITCAEVVSRCFPRLRHWSVVNPTRLSELPIQWCCSAIYSVPWFLSIISASHQVNPYFKRAGNVRPCARAPSVENSENRVKVGLTCEEKVFETLVLTLFFKCVHTR